MYHIIKYILYKCTVPYIYNLKDLNDEEIIGSFYDRELQKSIL